MRFIPLFVFGLAVSLPLHADVKMPAIFSDHMVLQQDIKVPIWGTADAGEKVIVTAGDHTGTATADSAGKWEIDLAPFAPNTPPLTVTITGHNTITIQDVLIGEVWVASGQSNMEYGLGGMLHSPDDLKQADDPQFRIFRVAHVTTLDPLPDTTGKWEVCTPDSVKGMSAVAYYFCRELRSKLNRPVGLIQTTWSGTPAQSWVSVSGLQKDPPFTNYLTARQKIVDGFAAAKAAYDQQLATFPAAHKDWEDRYRKDFDEKMKEWHVIEQQAHLANQPLPARPKPLVPEPQPPAPPDGGPNVPANLFNGMVSPILRYAIKGVIWYQGESNAGQAAEYRTLFPRMITDWREKWGQGDFAFLFVQLAGFTGDAPVQGGGGWSLLREAQAMTLSLPNTGMATAIDIGDHFDIHPKDKYDVGQRLSLVAGHVAYGENLVYSGPTYDKMAVEGDSIRVSFTQIGGGLIIGSAPWVAPGFAPTPTTNLLGFTIAGDDKKFVVADAKIDGSTVVVSSPQVPKPTAVRYDWANIDQANLYNREALPAFPFRSDNWDEVMGPATGPVMLPPTPTPTPAAH